MLSNCVSFCTPSSLCVVREKYSCEFVQQGGEVHSTETHGVNHAVLLNCVKSLSSVCAAIEEKMELCVICTVHVGDKGSTRYD